MNDLFPKTLNDDDRREETLEQHAIRMHTYQTPDWTIKAILSKELLTPNVYDPCAGYGVLSEAAIKLGYEVQSIDKSTRWGYGETGIDFLEIDEDLSGQTIFMNPPFNFAQEFIEHAHKLKARKIICFQRFSFWESEARREFWKQYPPNRIYICGNRATCWRMDLSFAQIQMMNDTPTAHAWFVYESGHPSGTIIGHIFKKEFL